MLKSGEKNTDTQERQQLGLLTQGDAKELSKFKKTAKVRERVRGAHKRTNTPDVFFDNRIDLITVEELAVIFRLAPQTIRNWIALGKIPYVKIGRKRFFQKRSLKRWINQKEEPLWQ